MLKTFQSHPCKSPLRRVWKLLLGGLKEDSVPEGDCTAPGFQVIYSQTTPCALKTVSSFAEPGYDLGRDDSRARLSITTRKTENKGSYYKLNKKPSSTNAHTNK